MSCLFHGDDACPACAELATLDDQIGRRLLVEAENREAAEAVARMIERLEEVLD